MHREEEGDDLKKEAGADNMLLQPDRADSERKAYHQLLQEGECRDQLTRHDVLMNNILNNILIPRGLVSHEQKWEDQNPVKTARDDITIGTEH